MKFRLIQHNSDGQWTYGGGDDTRKHLKVGNIYMGEKKIYDWHTHIKIGSKRFNSVCFEETGWERTPRNRDKLIKIIDDLLEDYSTYGADEYGHDDTEDRLKKSKEIADAVLREYK